MRALLLLLAVSPALAQVPAARLPSPPADSAAVDFEPLQTSAARAYLYSVAATGGLVAVGLLADAAAGGSGVGPLGDPEYDDTRLIVAVSLLVGPSVGNLTLGAGADVGRAFAVKGAGVVAAGGLLLVGLGTTLACVGADCDAGSGLVTAAAVVAVAGFAAGTAYDLVTIPGNAARARRHVRGRGGRVSLAPGYAARAGAPTLTLRARL